MSASERVDGTTAGGGPLVIKESAPGRLPLEGSRSGEGEPGKWLLFGEKYGLLMVFILVCAIFSVWHTETFATADNLRAVVSSQAVVAVLALGLLVPLVAGNFDLSVGSNAIMCSIAAASVMSKHGWGWAPALILAVALGMTVGLFNGILVTRGRLNGLIATLGTAAILGALIQWYTDNVSITNGLSQPLLDLGTKNVLGVPRLVVVAAVVGIAMAYLLTQTPFGRHVVAIGSNPRAARLVGVRTNRVTLVSFVIAGGLAGMAGVLIIASQGSGNPSADGIGLLLPALVGVFLGASAFSPGQFNVPGTVLALLLIAVLVNGLTLAGVAPWIQPLANGVALIVGVGVAAAFRNKRLGTEDV